MKNTKTNNVLNTIARLVVGCVFLFSSFVKGVDPMGTSYKIADYMTAWSIGNFTFEWALPMADFLSMFLITLEFTIGVALVLNCFKRITAWVTAIMMLFFTVTTLIDATTNLVSDCGCFGDAIKLTNWQTFWKNVVLDVFVVWILLTSNLNRKRRTERDVLIVLFSIAIMIIFGIYNIKNEPCIDFRPWKVGNQMIDRPAEGEEALEVKSYLKYRNKASGEIKEYESAEFMDVYNANPNFMEEWEFVDSKVVDPYEIKADGFAMLDTEGEDHAKEWINSPDWLIIMTVYELDKINEDGVQAMRFMHDFANENGFQLILLTSSLAEDVQTFLYENKMDDVNFYFADGTAIKTMLRSNPGFMLMKDAKVIDKWPYRHVFDINDIDFEN